MKREPLTRNSKIIVADLIRARRPLAIRRIAERNSIAWKTAKDNIKRLERRGIVKCRRSIRRTYCELTRQAKKDLGI